MELGALISVVSAMLLPRIIRPACSIHQIDRIKNQHPNAVLLRESAIMVFLHFAAKKTTWPYVGSGQTPIAASGIAAAHGSKHQIE